MRTIQKGCKFLLRRLLSQRRIGGKHTPECLLLRSLSHLHEGEHKNALKDWKRCIAEGLVLTKPKPSGRHVSLNPRRLREVYSLIE